MDEERNKAPQDEAAPISGPAVRGPTGQEPGPDADPLAGLGQLSYRRLIWRRFRKSKRGPAFGVLLILFYVVALGAPLFAPCDYQAIRTDFRYVPPQRMRWSWQHGLFVYGLKAEKNPEAFQSEFTPDPTKIYPVRFFHNGRLMTSDGPMFLLGTDRMGRDLLSRIIHGGRVSLTIGLVGVALSLIFGSVLGTVSGYFGGWVDTGIQRLIEVLSAFPAIPLWMALAAALPPGWSSIKIYFGITIILSLIGWGGLARQVRGKVLASREQDFVMAARSANAGHWYIITRHLLPGCYSHIIVVSTLAIPGMILGETALSFLGLGIRPPMTSWGVLLEEAQRVTVLLNHPWLLFPAVPVLVVVIAFNFVGDSLRDAADPYSD